MDRGWRKFWIKSLDSGMLKNPELWTFWSWCLLRANRKHTKIMVGFQEINLDPGQFIFGRKKAAIELDTTERKIRTSLDSLVKSKNVTIKSTNKFSIISIINWHIYQDENFTNDQLIRQPPTSNRPATDHRVRFTELQSYREEQNTYVIGRHR